MRIARDNRKRAGFLGVTLASFALLASASPAAAEVGPKWRIDSLSPTTVEPGGEIEYTVIATNVGDQSTFEPSTVTAAFPAGMTVKSALLRNMSSGETLECFDSSDGVSPIPPEGVQGVVCENPGQVGSAVEVGSGNILKLFLTAEADPTASGTLTPSFEVSGGGTGEASTVDPVTVTPDVPAFGFDAFDGSIAADSSGTPMTQAGGHPNSLSVNVDFNSYENTAAHTGSPWPVEAAKDVITGLPPGLVGNPTIADTCTLAELANAEGFAIKSLCPSTAQLGTAMVRMKAGPLGTDHTGPLPVFNMAPPAGSAARFGFAILGSTVVLDAQLRGDGDYGITVNVRNIPQALAVVGSTVEFWGVPASEEHGSEAPDYVSQRACPGITPPYDGGVSCPSGAPKRPFFRMPTACAEAVEIVGRIDSWDDPGDFKVASFRNHEAPRYPAPSSEHGPAVGVTGCEDVPVRGELKALPTSIDAETSSGLDVRLEVPNPGKDNPKGIDSSDIKKVKVTLPQGMTVNPSQAEGLGVCSPSQYESTELSFHPTPGTGCPENSKLGKVEVVTPLLKERIEGEVFIAQQDDPATTTPGAENPFDSLLALYVVLKNPQRGILIKVAGEVTTDESSGRIVTTFDDLPQLPFSSFDFKFREGARAPLVTPPTCGTYATETEITGHAAPDKPILSRSSFQITRGIGGGPCPAGGVPSFDPGFSAGAVNNNAGSFSPVNMRLTRQDGEQNLTKFSATLAPGLLAKLAGVEKCPEGSIAAAKAKSGRAELASPSCPPNSKIGRTLAGAGVGSVLTYVPGSIYLAGPYNGAPLSVVAITPAVAGPFDVGTVVVREALDLDPRTGVASVDGVASDPIPHILKGIPLKLRDLRVYVDRPGFTLNPTSCNPSAIGSTLWGSYADVFNPADDVPVARQSRFQASNCASLGFKPKLNISLKGGTKRGAHPALKAVLTPRAGDANIGKAVVKLPRSAFLDQGHIRTICTRVQWAAKACPPAAAYGKVKAWSPLLDEPLAGPVYLRSSNNKLPDLVFDLDGLVDIEVSGRIDSVKGGIRATFAGVPDAPVSRLVLEMQGGRKGLIQNSRNLCASVSRAEVKMDGQNGAAWDTRPVVRATNCAKRQRRHKSAG